MAITLTGQLASKLIESRINKYMNNLLKTEDVDYVIHMDTDSAYVNMEGIINKMLPGETDKGKITDFLSKMSKGSFQPFLDSVYRELHEYLNCYEHLLIMKLEAICDNTIWASKKNYVLSIIENEGVRYGTPKIKAVGLAAVKSSTPRVCRDALKAAFKIALQGTEVELQEYVGKFQDSYMKAAPEIIALPRGVSEIAPYVTREGDAQKGCPIHVRAAINHNKLVKAKGLSKTIKPIGAAAKIKYIYLKEPNTLGSHVIGFTDLLPKEFGLHQYIDYDEMFEKAFLSSVRTVTDKIGWEPVKTSSLSDLFDI